MPHTDSQQRLLPTGEAIKQHRRVKVVRRKLALAGVTDRDIGTMAEAASIADEHRMIHLRTASGTVPMVANGPIEIGDEVYTAAEGKVGQQTSGALLVGTAMSRTQKDGELVTVLRHNQK